MYARVSELMSARGYERTPKQCRTKLKHLRGEYMKVKKINGRSGHSRLGARIFELLDDILGHRPIANPKHVIDALHPSWK